MQPATIIDPVSASTTLSAASAMSAPFFTTFLPPVLMLVGILIGGILVSVLVRTIIEAVHTAFRTRAERNHYSFNEESWLG